MGQGDTPVSPTAIAHRSWYAAVADGYEATTRSPDRCSRAAELASSSARLLSEWDAWPLVQTQLVLWRLTSSSSSCHRATLSTGFLSLFFQPFRFHAWIHWVMPFFTYSASDTTSTSHGSLTATRPWMA